KKNKIQPTFAKTTCQYNYPLIDFRKDKVPTINLINNPWVIYKILIVNNSDEESFSTIQSQ
ncbi:6977_t:CDS:1, partial [Racocetra fulgida]